jgi:hypothetical protein
MQWVAFYMFFISCVRAASIQALVARRGFNKAAVALANKNARILWAMASNGKDYEALAA